MFVRLAEILYIEALLRVQDHLRDVASGSNFLASLLRSRADPLPLIARRLIGTEDRHSIPKLGIQLFSPEGQLAKLTIRFKVFDQVLRIKRSAMDEAIDRPRIGDGSAF